jgi:adenylate cyclase
MSAAREQHKDAIPILPARDGEGWPALLRYVARRRRLLILAILIGFLAGVANRYFVDPVAQRNIAYNIRSGLHGVGIALTIWMAQAFFAVGARSGVGAALRRLPVAAEVLIRSLVMAVAVIVVGVLLQFILYADASLLHGVSIEWLRIRLPEIVALSLGLSLIVGAATESVRLIGRPMLSSVLLGAYHRPAREQLIVMFLDLVGSTSLAEGMGELKVHDLLTRFFFDIDEPIDDYGGAVHAYVGDEAIVVWPLTSDAAQNARALKCYLAIEAKIARLASDYERAFGVAPRFRAGLHAGPVIVSECGDAKRQLAFFGDTMNVAARLCEQCKASDQRLIVSADLLRQTTIPKELKIGESVSLALRGRQRPIEAHAVES